LSATGGGELFKGTHAYSKREGKTEGWERRIGGGPARDTRKKEQGHHNSDVSGRGTWGERATQI